MSALYLLLFALQCVFTLSEWQLLAHTRNVNQGTFPSQIKNNSGNLNIDDPSNNSYSIIGKIGDIQQLYKDQSDRYKFRLIYTLSNWTEQRLTWYQNSWIQNSIITGYDPIDVPSENDNHGNCRRFHGLRLSDDVSTYIDGSNSTCTYNSVGRITTWTRNGYEGIPAFNWQIAMSFVLYIWKPITSGSTTYNPTIHPTLKPSIYPTQIAVLNSTQNPILNAISTDRPTANHIFAEGAVSVETTMVQFENIDTQHNESRMETPVLAAAITIPLLCIISKFAVFFCVYVHRNQRKPDQTNNVENNGPSTKEDNNLEINVEKTLSPSPQLNVTSLAMKSIDASETQNEELYGIGIDNKMVTKGMNNGLNAYME
eukprot:405873_1